MRRILNQEEQKPRMFGSIVLRYPPADENTLAKNAAAVQNEGENLFLQLLQEVHKGVAMMIHQIVPLQLCTRKDCHFTELYDFDQHWLQIQRSQSSLSYNNRKPLVVPGKLLFCHFSVSQASWSCQAIQWRPFYLCGAIKPPVKVKL